MPVGEDLDLDVARVGQVALEVDGAVAEEALALARRAGERLLELLGRLRDAEALAAAAARGLDRDRIADRRRRALGLLERGTGAVVPGTIGTPAARISSRARVLEPIASIADGRRADEDEAGVLAGLRERRGLGQEAVAGVDRLGAGLQRDLDDPLAAQVALGGGRGAEQVRLARAADVQRVRVGLGVHGDARDPELVQRPHHADRDLTAVGDQDLAEHAVPP